MDLETKSQQKVQQPIDLGSLIEAKRQLQMELQQKKLEQEQSKSGKKGKQLMQKEAEKKENFAMIDKHSP